MNLFMSNAKWYDAWPPWAGLQGLGQEKERPDAGGGEGKEGSRGFPSDLHKGKEWKAVGTALLVYLNVVKLIINKLKLMWSQKYSFLIAVQDRP